MFEYYYYSFNNSQGLKQIYYCVKCENPTALMEYDLDSHMCFTCYMGEQCTRPY